MPGIRVILSVYIESNLEEVADALTEIPEVVDVFEVTGEADIIAFLEADDVMQFRNILKNNILKIPGIKSTVSSVVMFVHKKDGQVVEE
ncbi:MAG: AsnC family transcriptional regulator [Candidatus Thorarchaeota archaeon]|nr:MAG: AsnC family transcriptional regulator [Candidatus Thorarchaeota archaeon]